MVAVPLDGDVIAANFLDMVRSSIHRVGRNHHLCGFDIVDLSGLRRMEGGLCLGGHCERGSQAQHPQRYYRDNSPAYPCMLPSDSCLHLTVTS
jgi:hypothetical protein